MLAVIVLGWHYPYLGFMVPLTMVSVIAPATARGRYGCGNLCPRGSFYDTIFQKFGGNRPVPPLFFNTTFRWLIMGSLMGFMALQISRAPADPLHWGRVFWFVCAATTAVGVLLGLIYRARTWCTICPAGTMALSVGGSNNYQLSINGNCKSCGICEKSCPMGFTTANELNAGGDPHNDCLKCSSCVTACPSAALSWSTNSWEEDLLQLDEDS
jgi:polyferredoxin